ncbi:MAG: AmpG family muropeptide MFS transporter [Magnetococcales bacterium]|nr:MFS transporter [Magnetococcales bacterium]NGZ25430.1 AmpG family muropeptide MFS transporter [Magnetococcales bacterium]
MTPSWYQSLAVYWDRRMAIVLLLGYASGLPLALTLGTLTLWLADLGLEKTTIGLFGLVSLPYNLKFLWAPLLDGLSPPWPLTRLGRRRGWLLLIQLGLMASILAMSAVDPRGQLSLLALTALAVAFFSASQDIVIDALRVEILEEEQFAAGAGVVVLGYRLGMLVSGAGALYLASFFGWATAYALMAVMMLPAFLLILFMQEPKVPGVAIHHDSSLWAWLQRVVILPFSDFLQRPGWWAMLAFILCYKLGDALAGLMTSPLYRELGFTLVEIANVTKVFGLIATLAGGVLGGALVARLGLMSGLFWFGLLQMLSNLMFMLLAWAGHDMGMLMATVAIENLSGGMGSAALVAYLSSLCNRSYTATQYALLSAIASLARGVLASGSGWLADTMGWSGFFLFTVVASLPALALLLYLQRRFPIR